MGSRREQEGVTSFDGFRGLRNTVPSERFDMGDLEAAPDVDITDSGDVLRRKGNGPLVITGPRHSLFATGDLCLTVDGASLKRVNKDYTETVLRSDMEPGRPVSYAALGGVNRVYYMNGVQSGVVENYVSRTLGIVVPGLPVANAFPGALTPGRYQFRFTYLRSDGQESGAGPAGSFDVVAGGGIQFTGCPVSSDPTVTQKALYLTHPNGDGFRRYSVLPNSATTALAVENRPGGVELRTAFLGPPPVGDIVGIYKGYSLVAAGNMLYPSEPYAHELFDLRKGIPFAGKIAIVACLTDVIYLCTDEMMASIMGDSPEQFVFNSKADYGAVPGTLAFASATQTGEGQYASGAQSFLGRQNEMVAFWVSKRGTVCMGMDGGRFVDLSAARFSFPAGERGAGLVRRQNGINQYVTVMRGSMSAVNSFS